MNDLSPIESVQGANRLDNLAHENFARLVVCGVPHMAAYEHVGLKRPKGNAVRLLHREDVQARIRWLQRQEDEILAEKRRLLEQRQWLWHDVDIGQFYEMVKEPWLDGKGNPILDEHGRPLMRKRERLKPLRKLPRELRMCVESLTYTDSGRPNLKLYNKADANRELRKLNGIDLQPSGDEGGNQFAEMSDHELFEFLARQAASLGVKTTLSFE